MNPPPIFIFIIAIPAGMMFILLGGKFTPILCRLLPAGTLALLVRPVGLDLLSLRLGVPEGLLLLEDMVENVERCSF